MNVSISGTHRVSLQPTHKPTRKEFTAVVVKAADGTELPEIAWRELVTNVKPRSITRVLKHKGFQISAIFNEKAYLEARKQYRQLAKHQVVDVAFQAAGIAHESHIDKAIKELLPMFHGVSAKKTAIVLKNVIRTVTNGVTPKEAVAA